jgi:hypothetical protein
VGYGQIEGQPHFVRSCLYFVRSEVCFLSHRFASLRNTMDNMSIPSTELSRDERSGGSAQKPLTVAVPTACTLTGLGPTKIWTLIKKGRLDVVRLDGRTLIKFPSLERLLSPEQDEQPAPRKTPRRKRARQSEGAEAR